MTRGERNNNPLNIRYNPANAWHGQKGQDDKGFVIFNTLQDGINAAAKVLKTYVTRHKCNNVELIVSRWAPACENDVEAYIETVCRLTGYDRKVTLTYHQLTMIDLIIAMARVESQMQLNRVMVNLAVTRAILSH